MTPSEIAELLEKQFPEKVLDKQLESLNPALTVAADSLVEIGTFLRDDANCAFDLLQSVTGMDGPAESTLQSVYHLYSVKHNHSICLKVSVPRDNPVVPSVSSVWITSAWHEREAYDLLGIQYSDHPNLIRILCPDDWVGFPLRKDYEFPEEYHGIRCK